MTALRSPEDEDAAMRQRSPTWRRPGGVAPSSPPGRDAAHAWLKERLRARHYGDGARLDPRILAREIGASANTVREALIWLAAERHVDADRDGGFFARRMRPAAIADLYALSGILLGAAAERADRLGGSEAAKLMARARGRCEIGCWTPDDFAGFTQTLFTSIARRTGNRELILAVDRIGERLHLARRLEPALLAGSDEEIAELAGCFYRARRRELCEDLALYHARRIARADEISREIGRTAQLVGIGRDSSDAPGRDRGA